MSHALDNTYGFTNAIAYVGELPWHRYGTEIPPNLTVEEAIAACPAVDFKTVTVPVRYSPMEVDDEFDSTVATQFADNFRVIIRDDTGAALGVATKRYSPVQIRDQWKGLDPLIKAGLARIETLGSIEGGKRIWGLVKFNAEEIPEWDELQEAVGKIDTYGLVMDDKTGKNSALLAPSGVRVVCRNTLEAGISGLTNCVRIRHTGDTAAKIEAAAEQMWGGIIATFERLSQRYRTLTQVKLTEEEHQMLVQDVVAIVPEDPEQFSSRARFKGAVKRAQAKRNAVHDLWFDGAAHKGDRTAWEALNGAVEALDHNRAKAFREPKNGGKVASMLTGTEAQMKAKITRNLLQFSQERLAA